MPKSSLIGIIYGAVSGSVRRVVIPDDGDLNPADHIHPGEEMLIIAKMDLIRKKENDPDLYACIAAVEKHRGVPSLHTHCNIVNKDGEVVGSTQADPAIDFIEGHTLVRRPQAGG